MTLTDWLLEQIDTDERTARDVQHQARFARPMVEVHGGGTGVRSLTDPDRWLAQCAAYRAVIEAAWADHMMIEGEWGMGQSRDQMDAKGDVPDVVIALASIFADRPGYQEWT